MSRRMKLDAKSPKAFTIIRRDPPREVDRVCNHRQNCFVNRFQWFWVFWKGINLIWRNFDFSGLFHVSIVGFQVDLCKKVGFACVINKLGGGLSDIGWFSFAHHFKEERQARFLSYQTPVGGTGTPLIEPWIEEVMGQKPDIGPIQFCLCGYRA